MPSAERAGILRARGNLTVPQASTSWNGGQLVFSYGRWAGADAELHHRMPRHLVILTEAGGTAYTQSRLCGRLAFEGRDRPGVVSFVPAGADRRCAYRHADLAYCALWIEPALAKKLRETGASPLPPLVNGQDPVVAGLLPTLRDDLVAGAAPSTVYVEHLAAVVLARIAGLDGRPAAAPGQGSGLGTRALARVQDHVEACLDAPVSLTELAGLLDMPVDSFARRFRSSTGLAPYAYVLERRIRKAEALLATGDSDIGTIALAVGFSSQSHLTATFRRLTGTTPRAYRRRIRSASL